MRDHRHTFLGMLSFTGFSVALLDFLHGFSLVCGLSGALTSAIAGGIVLRIKLIECKIKQRELDRLEAQDKAKT